VFSEVREWCIDNGEDPDLRIALCGYEGNEMPSSWTEITWKTGGGLGKIGKVGRGIENRSRERIWLSPHCYDPEDLNNNTFLGSFLEKDEDEE